MPFTQRAPMRDAQEGPIPPLKGRLGQTELDTATRRIGMLAFATERKDRS